MLNILILCPFTILFGLTYLYLLMGWTFLPGLLIFFLFMGVNIFVVKKGLHYLKEFMKIRGVRIKRTNEVFNNIKLIKSYSLERFFLKKIIDIRSEELGWLKKLFFRSIFTMVSSNVGPGIFLLSVFVVYVAAGYQLTSGKIFTTISVFNSFIWALNYLPNIVQNFIDMLTSSERLTNYLLSPKIEKWPNLFIQKNIQNLPKTNAKVSGLFDDQYTEQIQEREIIKREIEKEYFDNDNEKINLVPNIRYQEKHTLFDTCYDIDKKEDQTLWTINEQDTDKFAGSLFDIQIKNLDFFWNKFWVPKTKKEIEEEKKEADKKKKMKIMMGKKKEGEEKNKDKEEGDSDSTEETKVNKFHLKNINLEIKKGEFVCIIGKSGSGKSSLFQSILGELFARPSGLVDVDKQIDVVEKEEDKDQSDYEEHTSTADCYLNYNPHLSYLSQKPWIRNATLRENIIFDHEFDESRYNDCVNYSGLVDDIKILKDGDQTVIGDKGINLSGGQKVRVGLARALYNATDLYLFDDPISALDVNVGNHVFMKSFRGYLRNKTRIVITHSLGYLKYFDRIIFMDQGRILYDGSFDDLKEKEFYIGKVLY